MLAALVLGIILVVVFICVLDRKPPNLPPGIWGWPLLGTFPSQDIPMAEQVKALKQKYGDIFTWRIGGQLHIFLSGYEVIKTAMNRLEFSNRPQIYSLDMFSDHIQAGIVNTSGKVWQNSRRFALKHLINMGMGKNSYESVILNEVISLIKDFENFVGNPGQLPWSINVAVLNVIWRIVADRRYEVDDEEIHRFQMLQSKLFDDVSPVLAKYDHMPWIGKIVPHRVTRWLGAEEFYQITRQLMAYHRKCIAEHKAVLDLANPRDYVDYYLLEMEAQKDNPDSTLSELDLAISLNDLFVAGSETTASTIRWAIFYLAKHQDVQAKVHKELDSVLDRGQLPTLELKSRLPYLEAVTGEVHRLISLLALSVPHASTENTSLNGYNIPKGAVIVTSIECCHTDPELWERPNDFYPEHFLSEDGQVLKNRDGFLPFSVGKRVCPGEALANMELYLFLGGLLQNFHFQLPEGEDLNPKRNPRDRFVNAVKPFKVIISKRG
ncbi:hypothetical protein SK128_000310 [Halocaridina rubra]|uniref:Cytochrome P450 n=1 Tax=Halocaridina rubra TaxID=373956 RepID=A0AAN9FUK8_HALRR